MLSVTVIFTRRYRQAGGGSGRVRDGGKAGWGEDAIAYEGQWRAVVLLV